ncbi:hypothetical protein G6F56_013773 [Rhizopus delemar]|nr:hypothetical protein G6F56_013773 [Rhizopus delemar]
MSIDPSNRHTADNMITLTIAPGPSKPKDIMSFLKPIIDEIVALAELMGHAGHNSLYGCRICLAFGVVVGSTPYFPDVADIRSVESLIEGDIVS